MRKLFLLLCLITAGAQGVWASSEHWGNTRAEVKELTVGNVVYELCYTYDVTYYLSSYDFDTGVYTTNVWVKSNEQYYASAVRVNLSSGGPIVIEDNITDAGVTYPVKYVGLHTEEQSVDREVDYEWYEFFPTYIVHNDKVIVKQYKRIQSPTTINSTSIQSLTVKGNIEFKGDFTASSCHTAVFQGNVTFSNSMGLSSATQITFNGGATISSNGTLWVGSMSELRFNKLVHEGKIYCPSLTDIYFTNYSSSYLPVYSGAFSNYFVGRQGSQITCHLPQSTTESRIQQLKATAVFCDFKDIIAGESKVNYTITSDGNARINFVELKGNASYVSATGISQLASASSGSKSGTVKSGGNYAVEIRDVDFNAKNVQLLRNGHVVTPEPYEDQGQPLRYHEDLDLQQDVRYEVSVSDKVCTVSFAQGENYTGRILYQKSYNGTTSTGVVTGVSPTVACAQGSRLKLTIPYDPTSYTPNNLYLNGSEVTMTKSNGEATATITVPTSATARIDLTWQAPQQTYTSHQPQIMIMRSGEGQVMFKGAICLPSDEWSQYLDDYEQSGLLLSGRDGYETWVMTGNGPVSCTQTVTNVTAPDVDPRGEDSLDEGCWGFIIEITPVAGQKLKTLLLGRISEDELSWEDMVSEGYSNGSYVTYDASTNTYTFDIRGDYMNFGVGDYVVNIAMGPEETAVETGQTFNFVRKGGRGEAWIYWEDDNYENYFNEDGSYSVTIPNEQLTVDMRMHIQLEEGETFHVYKDGVDITSEFQYNEGTDYFAELDMKSATYTLLIDDAPDANPTWSIHNATEGDVVVEQTLKDGTTTTTTFTENFNELVIDDSSVSKVSLKVYLNTADISSSLRVERNGVDVTYQSTSVEGDGNGSWVTYEVPADQLIDATWNISNNTDRAQTFIVTGGTTEQVVEMAYEYLYNEPTLHAKNDGVPVTAYLPPYDSDKNPQVNLTLYVKNEERVTVLRNGVDVTNAFTKHDGYYEIDATDGNYPNLDTREALGFQINDPAVWKITVRSLTDQIKTINIANPDGMDITYTRDYKDGQTIDESISEAYRQIFFDDSDRENTSSVYLKVPIDEGRPVRVVRDGVDVSYQFTECDLNLGCLIYEASLTQNQTWDISYETSHRQTFIRKGGTKSWNVEVELDYPIDGNEKYFSPDAVGTPLYVDFPTYNSIYAPYAYIDIDVEDGSTFTVLRNGVDVTDKFTLVTGPAGASEGFTRYKLDESDYNDNNDGMTPGLGFTFRDPAVWQITIGDTGRYDLNNDNKVDISDVTKLVNKVLNR